MERKYGRLTILIYRKMQLLECVNPVAFSDLAINVRRYKQVKMANVVFNILKTECMMFLYLESELSDDNPCSVVLAKNVKVYDTFYIVLV